MSLSPAEQFADLIRKSRQPIILLPSYPTKDAIASAFALSHFLVLLGKTPTVAGERLTETARHLPFLRQPKHMLDSLSGKRDFVLSFDTTRNPILSSRVEETETEYRIYITPKTGVIDPRDFSFIPARFRYDIVFVLGSPDKESLGSLYEECPDIFYEMPIVNIDTRTENEHFGQLNLVDMTASSVAEILFGMFSAIEQKHIDEAVAEALLTGIVSATESFQKKNTTPRSLDIASKLITLGADREKIVLSLFKTQPFSTLKLWGRVLTNLRLDEGLRLVSARLSLDDFVQSRTRPDILPAILDRIKANYSSGSLFAVVYPDTNDQSLAILKTASTEHAAKIATRIEGSTLRGDTILFPVSETGSASETSLVETIRQALPSTT